MENEKFNIGDAVYFKTGNRPMTIIARADNWVDLVYVKDGREFTTQSKVQALSKYPYTEKENK